MNKSELVNEIATIADVKKSEAERALNALVETITNALKAGDKVQLIGFGTFEVKHRAARDGRNPRTGETIKIAAANVPHFSAGKSLKEALK